MKEAERKKLWDKYMKSKSPELREQLILEYANVVNLVAGRLNMYLGYTVDYDDLVGYGVFGLIDAIDKYDLTKNVKFEQRNLVSQRMNMKAGKQKPNLQMWYHWMIIWNRAVKAVWKHLQQSFSSRSRHLRKAK